MMSFKKLTEKSRDNLSEEVLSEIGNTARDIQSLGFYNWVGAVEGTLRKQNYLIKNLNLN